MLACACRRIIRLQPHFKSNIHGILAATYKSNIALDNLYPGTDADTLEHAAKAPSATEDNFTGVIPLKELRIQHCLSSGPGGQHVNKVNSKVEIRFNIDKASWIPEWVKPNLLEQQPNRVNKKGELIVTSEKTRKQVLNQADCLEKIRHMVFQASVKPKEETPEQIAVREKRDEARKKRNIEDKRRHSLMKRRRNFEL